MVSSLFAPILDSQAFVGLAFRVPDQQWSDRYALRVLEAYLDKRVFDELRINQSLAYSPGTASVLMRNFGIFAAYADVYVEDMDTAVDLMEREIHLVRSGAFKESKIEEIKHGLLLSEARKYERNSDIAEHFVESRFTLTVDGGFVNDAERLGAVTADDIHRVAREYLHIDQGVILRVSPTLTYTQLFLCICAMLVVGLLLGIRRRMRRKSMKSAHQKAA